MEFNVIMNKDKIELLDEQFEFLLKALK